MLTHVSRRHVATLLILAGAFTLSPVVNAKCGCPDDGHWAPKAAQGLGESAPMATDLAIDTAWQVYEFERDGIRYLQINDQYGTVRAATGRIGGTVWVMPMGTDADRVAVPGDAVPVGSPRVLYRGADIEVVLYQDGVQQRWLIRPTAVAE